MLQSIFSSFAALGSFLFSVCVVAAAVVGCLVSTGVLVQQVGTRIFGASDDKSTSSGIKTGAVLGFLWAVVSIYQVGNITALFSVIGLCTTMLFFAWLVWLFGPESRSTKFD